MTKYTNGVTMRDKQNASKKYPKNINGINISILSNYHNACIKTNYCVTNRGANENDTTINTNTASTYQNICNIFLKTE